MVISCNNKDSISPVNIPPNAPATAIVNGSQWYADSVYCYYKTLCAPGKLSFLIHKYNEEGILREEWGFLKIILDSTLNQKMYSKTKDLCFNDTLEASYHTLIDDGDVLGSSYTVLNNSDSYFIIEHYDTTTKEISGSFAGTYEKYDGTATVNTIKVTNGRFHTKIIE